MSLTTVIPGKVDNRGIRDMSIPDYDVSMATFALHAPIFHIVTPKGLLAEEHGTQWITTSEFSALFGSEVFDHKTPYYNPTSVCIQQVASAGQSAIGVRRLSANNVVARSVLAAVVNTKEVGLWERDFNNNFQLDENGDKVPVMSDGVNQDTVQGASIQIVEVPLDQAGVSGGMKVSSVDNGDGSWTYTFPLVEALAGVGDAYNRNGFTIGVVDVASKWKTVSEFVEKTGVFPFQFRMFEDLTTGVRSYATTTKGNSSSDLTLFETEFDSVTYSVFDAIGAYTNKNINRAVAIRPAPINDMIVYEESVEQLCQLLWGLEKEVMDNRLVANVEMPYRQMNPFTCQDHYGTPYFAIEAVDVGLWDTTHAVKVSGGISPFLDVDGNPVAGAEAPELVDPFNVLGDMEVPFSRTQGWVTNNQLMLADLHLFLDSLEQEDYIRNRQSVFWDVGYDQAVKDKVAELLGIRKDVMVILDATIWNPDGSANDVDSVYARMHSLVSTLRLYPESEEWGTATCRAAINTIQAKVTNEKTRCYFSGNIDLAYAFALFAGGASGNVIAARSPDHANNRLLRIMHSPVTEFEGETVAADNFNNGGITLRPYDVTGAFFRPALVGVYKTSIDSVLKDLLTNFLCVGIEKIAQDQWNLVSGDTTISADNYASIVKDKIERRCRDAMGGIPKQINAECYYDEDQPGGRAIMNCRVSAWFNKGKYMMNLDLWAYNEQDLEE